jgi:hypothetical protein
VAVGGAQVPLMPWLSSEVWVITTPCVMSTGLYAPLTARPGSSCNTQALPLYIPTHLTKHPAGCGAAAAGLDCHHRPVGAGGVGGCGTVMALPGGTGGSSGTFFTSQHTCTSQCFHALGATAGEPWWPLPSPRHAHLHPPTHAPALGCARRRDHGGHNHHTGLGRPLSGKEMQQNMCHTHRDAPRMCARTCASKHHHTGISRGRQQPDSTLTHTLAHPQNFKAF